jgi:hypothetical protein
MSQLVTFGPFSLFPREDAMAVGVDADQAVDKLGDLTDERAIAGRIS